MFDATINNYFNHFITPQVINMEILSSTTACELKYDIICKCSF